MENSAGEWERGTPHGVSIGSQGELRPAGDARQLVETGSTFAWSVAAGPAGEAFVATSAPAGVARVDAAGKLTKLFTTKDLAVQVVKVGPDGAVYAATAPNGAVYRIDPKGSEQDAGKLTPVFDSKAVDGKPKYIWDLSWDKAGRLYVATGAPGGVYRVPPAGGKPELWFQTDEPHVRAMAWGPTGELYAGTDGSGLVCRVSPDGKGVVLYEAGKREVTSLAVANNRLYLAAVGEKGRSGLPPLPVTGQAVVTTTITLVQAGGQTQTTGGGAAAEGSELDLLDLSGHSAPRELWSARDEVVYALAALPGSGVLAATGNSGHLLRLGEGDTDQWADVGHLAAQQVTGLAPAAGGGWWAVTANPGKVFRVEAGPGSDSTFESEIFDAGVRAQWGRTETLGRGAYELWARTGEIENPLRGWGPWMRIGTDGRADLGTSRYLQWKLVLREGAEVSSVGVNYLPQNVAPVMEELQVIPGVRANGSGVQVNLPQQVLLSFSGQSGGAPVEGEAPVPAVRDKSWVTAHWSAHDANGDTLRFALFYRREDETAWHLLKDKINEHWYTWEASRLPDGAYRLKVVASDAESHPAGQGLETERESATWVIATSAPRVEGLAANSAGGGLRVTATGTDVATPIVRAEYSIDAGEWRWVEPVGHVSDSLTERYDFPVPGVSGAGHMVSLRVWDRYENSGSAEVVSR